MLLQLIPMDAATDMIVNMLNALGQGAGTNVADVGQSPASYNAALYKASTTIHNTAVKPVTAVVLSIMAVLTLARTSASFDADRELGVKMVAATMFKIVLVIVAVQNAGLFLKAIDEVVTSVVTGINSTSLPGTNETRLMLGDSFRDNIDGNGLVEKSLIFILVLIPFLITLVVGVISIVLVFVRFLQLYMLTAFCSLPLAFFGHPDTKGIAVGYLKKYAVTAFQGAMLLLAVKLYQVLMADWVTKNLKAEDAGNFISYILGHMHFMLVGPLVMAIMLFGASSLAKAIVGEG